MFPSDVFELRVVHLILDACTSSTVTENKVESEKKTTYRQSISAKSYQLLINFSSYQTY